MVFFYAFHTIPMSHTKLIRLADAREHVVDNEPVFCVETGPSNVFCQQVQAQPLIASNPSNAQFQLQPASVDTILVRDLSYLVQGTATFVITPNGNWTANARAIASDGVVGFAETTQNWVAAETCAFGSVNQTVYPQDCLGELSRLNTPSRIEKAYYGGGCGVLDSFNNLSAVGGANEISNPLLSGADVIVSDSIVFPRGQGILVTTNPNVLQANADPATIVLSFGLRFKSSLSFLRSQGGSRPGLRGQSNYTINLNLNSLSNLFNFVLPAGYTVALTASNVTTFSAEVAWITGSPEEAIPWASQTVECSDVQRWIQTYTQEVASGGAISIAIANIQSDVIPTCLLISCVPTYALTGQGGAANASQIPMQFMPPIANQQLTFNNLRVLNGLNSDQLYDMSRRNGLSMSLEQFRGDVASSVSGVTASGNAPSGFVPSTVATPTLNGGFITCRPSRDFGISSTEVSGGVRANWSLSGTAVFVNNTPAAISSFTLRVIAIYDSSIELTPGGAQFIRGICSKEEYAMARIQSAHSMTSDQMSDYSDGFGGSFWGSVGNFFKKAGRKVYDAGKSAVNTIVHDPLKALRTAANYAEKAVEFVPGVGPVAHFISSAADKLGAGGMALDRRHHTVAQKRALARAYLAQ
jgi:hypothetical protein